MTSNIFVCFYFCVFIFVTSKYFCVFFIFFYFKIFLCVFSFCDFKIFFCVFYFRDFKIIFCEFVFSILPRHKHVIANRLFVSTLAFAYQQKGIHYQTPFPAEYSISLKDHVLKLYFKPSDIVVRNDTGFEVQLPSYFLSGLLWRFRFIPSPNLQNIYSYIKTINKFFKTIIDNLFIVSCRLLSY